MAGNPIFGHAGLCTEDKFGVGQGERLDRIEPFKSRGGQLIPHIIQDLLPHCL